MLCCAAVICPVNGTVLPGSIATSLTLKTKEPLPQVVCWPDPACRVWFTVCVVERKDDRRVIEVNKDAADVIARHRARYDSGVGGLVRARDAPAQ